MRILYVLRHNPWGIGGGCYASRSYLEAFGEVFAGAEIDACICAEYLDDGKPDEFPSVKFKPVPERTRLQKLLSIITGELHRFQTEVIRLLDCNRYDVCIFDHNAIAGTLASTCRSRGIRTIVINHNCEQEYFRDNTAGMKRTLFLPWVRRNECRSYKNCDYNVFLTEEDKALFGHLYGASPTQGIVGGCFMRKGNCRMLPH